MPDTNAEYKEQVFQIAQSIVFDRLEKQGSQFQMEKNLFMLFMLENLLKAKIAICPTMDTVQKRARFSINLDG